MGRLGHATSVVSIWPSHEHERANGSVSSAASLTFAVCRIPYDMCRVLYAVGKVAQLHRATHTTITPPPSHLPSVVVPSHARRFSAAAVPPPPRAARRPPEISVCRDRRPRSFARSRMRRAPSASAAASARLRCSRGAATGRSVCPVRRAREHASVSVAARGSRRPTLTPPRHTDAMAPTALMLLLLCAAAAHGKGRC